MIQELTDRTFRKLVIHRLDDAAAELETAIRPSTQRFGRLADLSFANDEKAVARILNAFHTHCEKTIDTKCYLLQHNGFVFNSDLWYFEPQAFDVVNDISKDFEWLCTAVEIGQPVSLVGLESIQEDFAWYVENEMYEDEQWSYFAAVAELLVKVRFAQLIDRVVQSRLLNFKLTLITNAYDREAYCVFNL